MPKCIDDPSRSYTGKEPSPKGLGYCAHTHSVGTTKTGNDGNTWTVETTYKGTKRWVKKSGSGKRRSTKRSSGKRRSTKRTSKKTSRGKRRSTKRSSGKRRSTKRSSKKKTSGKRRSTKRSSRKRRSTKRSSRKRRSTKRSSRKRRSTKRTSKKKTSGKRSSKKSSCGKIIYEKRRSAGLKSGREYHFTVYSVNAKGAPDWKHKKKFKMVYNPSAFKEKMEKLLCSWSKGKKITMFSVAYNNRLNEATVNAGWK